MGVVVGEEDVVGSNAQGAVNSLTPPCTGCCCDGEGVHLASRLRIISLCHLLLGEVAGVPEAGPVDVKAGS